MSMKVKLVVPRSQLRAITNGLRKIDKKLPGQLRKVLKRVARPVMNEQRRNVRSMPTKGPVSRGTRRRIASGVKLQLRTSKWPTMRIITHAPWPQENNDAAMLPRGFDTFFSGFDTVWGRQVMSGESWFIKPAASRQRQGEVEVARILNMTAQEIAAAAAKNMKAGRPSK